VRVGRYATRADAIAAQATTGRRIARHICRRQRKVKCRHGALERDLADGKTGCFRHRKAQGIFGRARLQANVGTALELLAKGSLSFLLPLDFLRGDVVRNRLRAGRPAKGQCQSHSNEHDT